MLDLPACTRESGFKVEPVLGFASLHALGKVCVRHVMLAEKRRGSPGLNKFKGFEIMRRFVASTWTLQLPEGEKR